MKIDFIILVFFHERHARREQQRKVRLNFELNPALKQNLVDLQLRTKSSSTTEVFRKALALLELVTAHIEDGGQFVLRHKDGREEMIRLVY